MAEYREGEIIAEMKGKAIIKKILKKSKTPALDGAEVGDEIEFRMNVIRYGAIGAELNKQANPVMMHNTRTGKTSRLTHAQLNRCISACEWREIPSLRTAE